MKTALFVDFEDSFTFNVVQELTKLGTEIEVINWKEFKSVTAHQLLVLGPGPGHPDDYQIIFDLVQAWINTGKKVFAVCLGHQILWRMKGYEIIRSCHPQHGQKIELTLNRSWQDWLRLPAKVMVQRYNSLAVRGDSDAEGMQNLTLEGEIIISRSSQIISYQFHPESMGTMCRSSFFRPILRDLL